MHKVRSHAGARRYRARRSLTSCARRPRKGSLEPLEDRLALAVVSAIGSADAQAADSAFGLYASAVYKSLLERAIDPAAMSYWTSQLNSGVPIQDMAGAASHSPEFYAKEVIGPDYQQYLDRPASASDIAVFTAALQAGASDEQVEASLVASDEFFNRAGATSADWIQAVYTSVLGRPADSSGSAYWLAAMSAGATRGEVALAFTQSAEHETERVQSDYRNVLGWSADSASIDYWVSQLEAGSQTSEEIVAAMVSSDDFFQSATGQIVTTVAQPSANSWFLPSNAEIDATAASNPQVMFLGDSLTYGWTVFGTDAWTQYFSQFQPLNAGIPGDTTQNILWRLDNGLAANIHPKLVVLMAGTNNAASLESGTDIAAGVKAIVDKLHQAWPDTKVLVMGIPPTGASAADPLRETESETNAIIRTFADGVNTFYGDITPDVLDAAGNQVPGVFFPDDVHLTGEGYQIYAQAIAPLVDQLLA